MHNFFSAPITPRNIDLQRVGVPGKIVFQCFSFIRDLAELKITGMPGSFLDCVAKFFLRRLTKAWQFRNLAGLARFQQLLDRADLELLVKGFDLFRAETGNGEQLENCRWEFRMQFLQVFQRAGGCDFFNFIRDAFANARNLAECFFVLQIGHTTAPGFNRARRIRIGSDFERILAFQFEQRADFLQNGGDVTFGHHSNR